MLGVGSDATFEEIRRAFLRAAKRLHPDRAPGDAAAQAAAHRRFLDVRIAWETLRREAEGK